MTDPTTNDFPELDLYKLAFAETNKAGAAAQLVQTNAVNKLRELAESWMKQQQEQAAQREAQFAAGPVMPRRFRPRRHEDVIRPLKDDNTRVYIEVHYKDRNVRSAVDETYLGCLKTLSEQVTLPHLGKKVDFEDVASASAGVASFDIETMEYSVKDELLNFEDPQLFMDALMKLDEELYATAEDVLS